jgi:hypothetical protein
MWSSVLVLAVVTAADPLRLIATFVVISRSRPVPNLLGYLLGCLIMNSLVLLIPLVVLHFTQIFEPLLQNFAGSATAGGSTVQPVPIGMGVFALLIAAVMTARLRVREEVSAPAIGGAPATAVLDTDTATTGSASAGRWALPTMEGSALRRLFGRLYNAWENGSPWVSVLMGMAYSPVQVTIALALIATSGASIGTQLSAAIVFVVVILAIVEIILVSCFVAPAKTQEVLQPLHRWVQAHRQPVLAAVFAVVGLSLLATGMSLV